MNQGDSLLVNGWFGMSGRDSGPGPRFFNVASVWMTGSKLGNRLTRRPATVDIFGSSFWRWHDWKPVFFNVFYMFHFWKAFRVRVSFCTAWANSIWKTWFFVRAKWSFSLNTPRKKVWKCLLMQEIPRPNGLEAFFSTLPQAFGKFFQNGTCDGSSFPPLEASRPLPTIFVGSSMGFVFLGKSDWLPLFQVVVFLGMRKRNNIFYQRNIKLMFAHVNKMCKRSNIFYERSIVRTR